MDFSDDQLREKQFIMETNCNRRHLTNFQRIELAYKMEPVYKELAKRRMRAGLKNVSPSLVQNCTSDEKGRVIDMCAKIAGVSSSLYNMGKCVLENAPPEVIQEVRVGRLSISKVYGTLQEQKSTKDYHPQQSSKLEKVVSWLPKGVKLFHNSFNNIEKEIPDGLVDLLITLSAPGVDSLAVYSELMRLGKRVLNDDSGWLAIAAPHEIIHDVISSGIKAGLHFEWMFAAIDPNSMRSHLFPRIKSEFQPVLLFASRARFGLSEREQSISDVITVDKKQEMEIRVAHDFIKIFSPENGVVFDPMMGHGETASAAINLKRQFIGSEMRLTSFESAKRSVAALMGADLPVVE